MEVAQKILEFLDEPEFCQRFRKFNDSRKWVATLSRKKAISDAHLQSIQSKPTSDEANDYLLTLIKNDPSIKKLEVLSEALKEDDTHNNQLALAKMIDQFLVSMVKDPAPSESNGVSINHEATLPSVGLDITSSNCCKLLQSFLMSPHVSDAKSVMESLYDTSVIIISDLLKSFKVEVINGATRIISTGILVKGMKVEDVKFAESTEEVFSKLDIPKKWNDLSVLWSLLTAIQVVHPSSYQKATAVLDHYQNHLIWYRRTKIMMKNKQSLQDKATLPSQDEVEAKITLKDSIFQLRYESCNDLWLVVLAEGSDIPRDQIKYGSALPGNSSVITFHIPKRYIRHLMEVTQKGPVIWAMLELRVIRIEVPGYFIFEVNWNTATLPIRDSLLTNRDLFRNTKGLSDTFQAAVDLMPPLPGKKGLPLQKYKPRLSSGFFTDVLVFDPVEKGSESTEVLQKSLQALQHLKKQPNIIPEMEKLLTKQMKVELDALFEAMESSSVAPRKAISSDQPLTVENPKLDIISKSRELAELQERIAHLQEMVEQKNLDLAKLQGQVVDMESLRASNQALFVKKTQVECERVDLQKKYSELQKKYSDAEKRVVDMEKKHDDAPSDLEKKLTKINQEVVKQAMLEILKDKEIEQLKEIPQAKKNEESLSDFEKKVTVIHQEETEQRKLKNLEIEVEHYKRDIKDLQRAHERIRKRENEGLHRKIKELQDRIQQQMIEGGIRNWREIKKCQQIIPPADMQQRFCAITVTETGHLAITDLYKSYLYIYNRNGTELGHYSVPGFGTYSLNDIAFNEKSGDIVIADNHWGKIHFYTTTGNCKESISVPGKPQGIAVSPKEEVFMTNKSKHCVFTYKKHPENTSSLQFGSEGATPGKEFSSPQSLAFSPDGLLCVADHNNERVQFFTDQGRFVKSLKMLEGHKPNYLATTRDGHLLVSCTSENKILIYNIQCEEPELVNQLEGCDSPHGVTVDKDYIIYVCNPYHGIQVF